VGPRTGLDDTEKRKILPLPKLEFRPLSRPACGQSLHRLRYLPNRPTDRIDFCSHSMSVRMMKPNVFGKKQSWSISIQYPIISLRKATQRWQVSRPRFETETRRVLYQIGRFNETVSTCNIMNFVTSAFIFYPYDVVYRMISYEVCVKDLPVILAI
jgi:hypothetical protein